MEPLDGIRKASSRFPQYLIKAIFGFAWAVAVVMILMIPPESYRRNARRPVEIRTNNQRFCLGDRKKDFKLAEQYCTQDFKDYIENAASGPGYFADGFGLAVTKGYDLKLVEVKGFYFK